MSDQEADVNDAKPVNPFGRTCDSCDKPATHSATDVAMWPDFAKGYRASKPLGAPKFGCDTHRVSSILHEFERPQ